MSTEDKKNIISSDAGAPQGGQSAGADKKRRIKGSGKAKKVKKGKSHPPLQKRPLICPPEAADRTRASVALGWALRAAVLFVTVFGMTLFVCDALGFTKEELGNVGVAAPALSSLIFTVLLALCLLRTTKKLASAVFCLLIAGGAAWMAAQNVFPYLYRAAVNCAVDHLYSRGYLAVIQYALPEEYGGFTMQGLCTLAAALLSLLYALAYVPFLMRRTRLLLPAAVSVLTLVPVFVCNLTRSNWGVTFVIAGFSGVLVMCVYDRFYQRRPDPDEFDTVTAVFEVEGAPAMPQELTSREARRLERKKTAKAKKAARKAERAARRKRRRQLRGKEKMNADEDISDYFAPSKLRRAEKKPKTKAFESSPEARREKRAEKDEMRRARKAKRREERRRDRDILAARRRAREGEREITRLRASSGGYAGAAMLLLALLILIIPAATTKDSFRLIGAIDDTMEYYREYVTAFLMGDDPLLDELAYEGEGDSFSPRSTEAQHLHFTGVKLMEVQTPAAYPVYLRGWIATGYDSEAGAWITADPDSDTFKTYRTTFGTAFDPSEQMFYRTYAYAAPDAVADVNFSGNRFISNISKYGFVAMQVNMKRLDLKGHLVYMPSFSNRRYSPEITTTGGKRTYAMRAWGSKDASKLTYTDYFDGIYTGYRFAKDTDGYAAVAYVTSMKNTGFYKNVADLIVSFNADRALIESDIAKKEESVRLYGQMMKNSGEFRTEADSVGNYTVSLSDGSIFYTVSYDTAAGNTVIRVPVDGGCAVYVYETASGKLLSKKTELEPSADGEESGRYAATAALPALIRYLEFYTEAERSELRQLWRLSDLYTNFVYNTYTGKADSAVISELVKKIISEAHSVSVDYTEEGEKTETIIPKDFSRAAEHGTYSEKEPYSLVAPVTDAEVYEQRHRLTMEFINWLRENCSYSLTPALSDAEGYYGVEKFLAITREGYCVQFASALTLMLRESGIPARYVEGYIASDFNRNYGKENASSYTAYVRDSSAHAWVEVWYDGIGWVQYEATPEYYSNMYEYGSSDPITILPIGPGGEEGPDEDDPGLTDEELAELIRQRELAARREMMVRIVVIAAALVVVAAAALTAFGIIGKRAKKKAAEREALISRLECNAEPMSDAAKRLTVRQLGDMLALLLSECGCAPKEGEFRSDYAARLYGELEKYLRTHTKAEDGRYAMPRGGITPAELERDLDIIAAAEFGGEDVIIPDGALPPLAKLWRILYGDVYHSRVGVCRRAVLFYLKQTL